MLNQYNGKLAFLTLKKLAEKSVDDNLIKLKRMHAAVKTHYITRPLVCWPI